MEGQTNIIRLRNGFHVWTRKVGESPIKVLLLHGGPGLTHDYLENFQEYLPPEGIEIYFYEQLGSFYSDQPDQDELWNLERFCDEVEEVRLGLGLSDFYLYGHGWGGMLAIEYALKYGDSLKGLIISNITASTKSFVKSGNESRDALPAEVVEKMKSLEESGGSEGQEYENLYWEYYGKKHICRLDPKPEPVARTEKRINLNVLEPLMGDKEFDVNGALKDWDRWENLNDITRPSLVIAGRHDALYEEDIEEMGRRLPNSRVAYCEDGSLLAMWDDPNAYFKHILSFLQDVEDRKIERQKK
ncbi:proline iminopeptidase-family hydrolase [Planococcus shenhongbingii]|uniref:proline iminopeptidase-family hydrolase n=1 Tax=Planococcus shenhongbingii TaxID=3058398 RepID=UPI002609D3D3|nr:proline iminopeptidase-family hydrolase [Planococcus sp. N016]WKA56893.1 proline iminopeptidase-family hydrolase [Planococcus sp. N016]